ncbi:hypothetical protein [Streptomyces sp. NPDC051211]
MCGRYREPGGGTDWLIRSGVESCGGADESVGDWSPAPAVATRYE